MRRPCLDCNRIIERGSRCADCEATRQQRRQARHNARRKGGARSTLPKQARERDGVCQHCGHDGSVYALQAHHIIPVARGGPHTLDNLVTLCALCHRKEHAR